MNTATRHSAILIGSYIATSILNYAFGVLLSWFFNPSQYGILGVAQSLLLLLSLAAGSGFAWTAAQDLAAQGLNGQSRLRFRAALLANSILGLLISLGLWAAYLAGWLPLGIAYRLIIPLIGLTTFILAMRAVMNGAARGLYLFTPVAINLIGEVVVKLAFGLALVKIGLGVEGVIASFALGAFVSLLHSLWIIRKGSLWGGKSWYENRILAETAPLFAGMLGTALMLNLDVLGLKLLAPTGQGDTLAGFYQAAVILARTPVFIAQALALVLFSYAASEKSDGKGRKTSAFLTSALKAWTRLLLPGSLALVLAPKSALTLFFPAQYQSATTALQISAVGGLLLALVTLLTGVFQGHRQLRLPAISAGIAVITQCLTLGILIPRVGVIGSAISLVVAGMVSLAGMSPLLIEPLISWRKNFRPTNPLTFGTGLLFRVTIPLAALAIPLVIMPDSNREMALIKYLTAGVSYLAVLMLINIKKSEIAAPGKPVAHLVMQFMQVLMGG